MYYIDTIRHVYVIVYVISNYFNVKYLYLARAHRITRTTCISMYILFAFMYKPDLYFLYSLTRDVRFD